MTKIKYKTEWRINKMDAFEDIIDIEFFDTKGEAVKAWENKRVALIDDAISYELEKSRITYEVDEHGDFEEQVDVEYFEPTTPLELNG